MDALRRLLAACLPLVVAALAGNTLAATAPAAPGAATSPAVRVLIWDEFISPKILKLIKNRDGINVELVTFSTTEERDAKLAKNAGRIDLVVADSAWVSEYRRRGLIQPVDATRVPSLKHVPGTCRATPRFMT